MLTLPPSVKIYVASTPVDARKGFDGLAAVVEAQFGLAPLSGHLFVFFSKRCDRVRVVYWDRTGFAMWTKRLECGRFKLAFSADGKLMVSAMEAAELALIVEGIDLAGARRRPRWEPRKTAPATDSTPQLFSSSR